MIPPLPYISFMHHASGTHYYVGDVKKYRKMYKHFIKNPYSEQSIANAQNFNNKLPEIGKALLQHGAFCVVFVTKPIWCMLRSSNDNDESETTDSESTADEAFSKYLEPVINVINKHISTRYEDKQYVRHDRRFGCKEFKNHFIVAWDVFKQDASAIKPKLSTHCAIINVESIMDMPIGNQYMTEGNIFIAQYGTVLHNNLSFDDVIKIFDEKFA
jgi:hypothetical protein